MEHGLCSRLVSQLDTLVAFLALSNDEVYDLMRINQARWFDPENQDRLPMSSEMYRTQVAHSAHLLGYSYFETYLSDLARMVYRSRPAMLPKKRQLSFEQLLECNDYDGVISSMIEKEIMNSFYASMDKVVVYFEQKLHLSLTGEVEKRRIVKADLIRNCLIHNTGRVDSRLADVSDWKEGQTIMLSVSEVHSFGLDCRRISASLSMQAKERYGIGEAI